MIRFLCIFHDVDKDQIGHWNEALAGHGRTYRAEAEVAFAISRISQSSVRHPHLIVIQTCALAATSLNGRMCDFALPERSSLGKAILNLDFFESVCLESNLHLETST